MQHTNEQTIGHAIPKSAIVGSYVGLLFLTAIMVGLSRLDVDRFSLDWIDLHAVKSILIMSVALVMGIIVSMFLMGLRYDNKLLNLTIFLSNFVFLLIFVLFTWADTSFRGEVDPTFNSQGIDFKSPVKAEASGGHGEAAGQEAAPGTGAAPHQAPATSAEGAPSAGTQPPVPTHETAPDAGKAPASQAAPAGQQAPAKPAAPAPAH